MWELFTGPLTWQHFCRLAFRDTSNKQSSLPINTVSSSSHPNHQNTTQQNQNCEPEPVPALLVSSVDKEWLTISPYAVKFWDKLNLEPYSKHKNIAYVVFMPDFGGGSGAGGVGGSGGGEHSSETPPELDECEAVRDYFKELTSAYELCRLGLHRPALRVAPEHGFVRVPLAFSKQTANKTPKVKVDPWFTQIQANR